MIGPWPRVYLTLFLAAFFVAGCSTSPMSRIDANRALYESWPFEVQEAVLAGKIIAGMTPEMVRMTLGEPTQITDRAARKGPLEVWIYKSGGGGGMSKALKNTSISMGTGIGPVMIGSGTNLGSLGGSSNEPIEDEREVVFQNGVVVRSDAGR